MISPSLAFTCEHADWSRVYDARATLRTSASCGQLRVTQYAMVVKVCPFLVEKRKWYIQAEFYDGVKKAANQMSIRQ